MMVVMMVAVMVLVMVVVAGVVVVITNMATFVVLRHHVTILVTGLTKHKHLTNIREAEGRKYKIASSRRQ